MTRGEARILEALSPHLVRAAQFHQRIGALSQVESGRDTLLDLLPYGAFFLDVRRRPIYTNREAERILAAGDGLSVAAGFLRAARPEARRAPEPASQTLARVFHLTPALSRLAAALAAGRTLFEHAEAAGVSIGTARGQLKELFSRTGTGRQPELVRLLLSSVAQLRLDDEA